LRPYTRTSFHHQPEAQHPKSSAIHKPPADYPIFTGGKIRVNSISWDDVKTILPDQVLEIRVRHGQLHLQPPDRIEEEEDKPVTGFEQKDDLE
jgi:hypothetical protein